MSLSNKTEKIVFGGGCFWCTEAIFESLRGVVYVISGYSGGNLPPPVDRGRKRPTYEDVSTGKTGHAEVVKIEYDPQQISFNDLLTVFFATHDPTTPNRQSADAGTQYRSAIFYTTKEQKKESEAFIKNLNISKLKVITDVRPLEKFYEAEKYHQKYHQKNISAPYCEIVINPKLEKLKERFNKLLKP